MAPLSASEASIEAELKTKGLNAPRLTPQVIDHCIINEWYVVPPGTTMTICALYLRNGFIVVGESAAASPENFDEAIGRRIARENARAKIWALEGYLLKENLLRRSEGPA
jgi:Phage protein (N4 Gp49/phage Sf6 gene 66) family